MTKRIYQAVNRQEGKTPLRAVRIQTELWEPAKQKAHLEGKTISDILREALAKYLEDSPA